MGCYLSFSRGALAALAAGLLALVVLAPARERVGQLRAAALVVGAGAAAALAAGLAPAVRTGAGAMATREREGAIVLAVAVVVMAAAALAARLPLPDRPLALPSWSGWAAAAAIAALLVVPIVAAGGHQQAAPATGATNQRFSSLGSNRYAYWRVAIDTGADHPLAGVGASGFRVEWLRRRHIDETVRDAHSLELETFAELGLVGGRAARRAAGRRRVECPRGASPRPGPGRGARRGADGVGLPQRHRLGLGDAGADPRRGRARRRAAGRRGRQSSSAIRGASRLKTHAARTQVPR